MKYRKCSNKRRGGVERGSLTGMGEGAHLKEGAYFVSQCDIIFISSEHESQHFSVKIAKLKRIFQQKHKSVCVCVCMCVCV